MRFADDLKNGRLLKGLLLTTPSTEMAEAVSHTGIDWAFIDIEHSPMGFLEAQNVARALGGRAAAVIRVPDHSPTSIKKALDTGCDGIIVPQVNTREEAAAVVEAAKYAPQGNRSVGIGRAHKYGAGFQDYMGAANEATAVIVQIEHKKAVENIDGILSVAGVAAVFIGPYDLSASFGVPGQIDNPSVKEAIEKTYARAKAAKMPVGVFAPTVEAAQAAIGKGATLLAVGIDTGLLVAAAKNIAAIGAK